MKKLYEQLKTVSGKKVYGYLPQDVKRTVDEILAELAKAKQVSHLYEKWCELERLKYKIPDEAEMIRKVYELFLDGYSMATVAEMMVVHQTDKIEWHRETIRRILTNEKYTGDCLLQKTFTADCITHKAVKNVVIIASIKNYHWIQRENHFVLRPLKIYEKILENLFIRLVPLIQSEVLI